METIIALASSLGLATATGLNAYLPLLTVSVLSRLGLIQLSEPFDLLAHPIVMIVLAALAIIDFIGDKVPAVDSVLHIIGLVISPIAGAIVALAAAQDVVAIHPAVVAIAAIIAAAGTQSARASIRPAVTAATGGTANSFLSFLEDALSFVLSLLAVFLPILALIITLVLAFVAYRFIRGAVRVWREANLRRNGVSRAP
ncbi:hypothetical protein A6A03_17670 [Chloroflexus islandicus]|jgi:hypothetical protein|uniref:DUF4126 domain-containing protein n=1 Tax=Chloroflexus islandicus TaxID=1707952 RepID=A0A178M7I3_9CHLR|nr:DUF4126 domain-containing protein [Chloroflexus islandicus]OAN43854.1 hypothetical protein A6A03_17670 [Chloroflexus islandicus]GIV64514.1 MAG: hypothetical protein KatS3mg045_1853 [Bellilinea sp.]